MIVVMVIVIVVMVMVVHVLQARYGSDQWISYFCTQAISLSRMQMSKSSRFHYYQTGHMIVT